MPTPSCSQVFGRRAHENTAAMSSATATAGALKTTDLDREEGRFNRGGFLLGIGFGGFVDGIVLHQLLQWHHMLTSTGDYPATTIAGLEKKEL